jgi:micrococcal nuclease
VIDGDTIELSDGRRVRYIGVDTPETVDPSQPVGCFGREASDRNRLLVEGKTVLLEKDVRDRPLWPAVALRLRGRRDG